MLTNSSLKDDKGATKYGVCTSFFDRFPKTDIPVFVRRADNFRLPLDKNVPVILIGAGSGIAPFRSFWQEREVQMSQSSEKLGKIFLFFGCRTSKNDNIYGSELTALQRKGVIEEVFLALSREPERKKVCFACQYSMRHCFRTFISLINTLLKCGYVFSTVFNVRLC